MTRFAACIVLALALVTTAAAAEPKHVKPDRAAIDALLAEFIPDVVAQKDLKRGWQLTAGVARATSYSQWIKGNTSIQTYPAKGTSFKGWLVNYSYPGDVGFDVLVQPTKASVGAWSFRAEAQKIHGSWKITTWYPVATYAPPGRVQTVLGPNDIGPSDGASAAGAAHGRLGAWALLVPVALVGGVALAAAAFGGTRWARRRGRVRAIERRLRT